MTDDYEPTLPLDDDVMEQLRALAAEAKGESPTPPTSPSIRRSFFDEAAADEDPSRSDPARQITTQGPTGQPVSASNPLGDLLDLAEEPSPAGDQPTATPARQPTVSDRQAAVSDQQTATPDRKPVAPVQQPVVPDRQPVVPVQQPVVPVQQRVVEVRPTAPPVAAMDSSTVTPSSSGPPPTMTPLPARTPSPERLSRPQPGTSAPWQPPARLVMPKETPRASTSKPRSPSQIATIVAGVALILVIAAGSVYWLVSRQDGSGGADDPNQSEVPAPDDNDGEGG